MINEPLQQLFPRAFLYQIIDVKCSCDNGAVASLACSCMRLF